ncbi:hypothetical protein [Egbenema bharatensis]|uniref:hypothetical protein n=1 Tax=Egbenema bharatensis TaxID=3463334 RepID=UPI003A8BDE5D
MNRNLVLVIGLSLAIALPAIPAQAQFRQGTDRNSQGYVPAHYQGQPMTRSGFAYLTQLGRGMDAEGYYRHPVRTRTAFGQILADGIWAFPMEWHPEHSILLHIRSGWIYRQDYQLRSN